MVGRRNEKDCRFCCLVVWIKERHNMFSKPKAGWCTFTIEDFEFPFSYIQNTPQDFIDQLINFLDNRTTFSILLNGEGPFCMLASCGYWLYVITDYDDVPIKFRQENSNLSLLKFDINIKNLVQEFIDDIEKHEEDFADWNSFYNCDELKKYDLSKLKIALENYKC